MRHDGDAESLFGPAREELDSVLGGRWRRWTLLIVLLCLAGAAYLRFHNIGKFGFWTDEFFHVFGAQSFLKDGSLMVPLHGEYTRSTLITYLTAASFKVFGVSEVAARAPFAAVNVVFLGFFFVLVRRIYGLLPAVASLAVLSFSPFMIEMSRECRMYTVFQLVYTAWTFMFLLGFEPFSKRPGWEGRLDIDARWLAGAIVLLPLSLHFHDLTMNGGLAIIAYTVGMFLWESLRNGPRNALFSKYGLAVTLTAIGTIGAFAVAGDEIMKLALESRQVPDWASVGTKDVNFYRYLLSDNYPVFFFIFPLACFTLIKDHGRRGFYPVVSFIVLLVLHSFVFGRKGDRYVFYIFPLFVLVSSSLVASICATLVREMKRALSGDHRLIRFAAWTLVIPAVYVAAYPWFSNGLRVPNRYSELDWKAEATEIEKKAAGAEIINTSPMPFLFYAGRVPDFYMLGEIWKDTDHAGRLIRNVDDLRAALDRPGAALLVTDQGRFRNRAYISRDMEDLINSRTQLELSNIDPRIRFYREKTSPK